MDQLELSTRKKKLPGWFRVLLWLALGCGLALIVAVTAFIGLYIAYPVSPPPIAPRLARMSMPSVTLLETSSSLPATFAASTSKVTFHSDPIVTKTAAQGRGASTYELVAEATQPTAELKAKAQEINESFSSLCVEFESYLLEKGKRKDPDEMTEEEGKAFLKVHGRMSFLRRDLKSCFGSAAVDRFDQAYLGMFYSGKVWEDAAVYCFEERKNWKEALYCCRQLNSWGGVTFAAMSLKKIATGSAEPYRD